MTIYSFNNKLKMLFYSGFAPSSLLEFQKHVEFTINILYHTPNDTYMTIPYLKKNFDALLLNQEIRKKFEEHKIVWFELEVTD